MVMKVECLGMAGDNAAAIETWLFSKTETITAIRQEFHVWVSTQKAENRVLKILVDRRIIHSSAGGSQTVEAIQKPTAKASKQKNVQIRNSQPFSLQTGCSGIFLYSQNLGDGSRINNSKPSSVI